MSEEKQHHGLFHHHKDEDRPSDYPQSDGYSENTETYGATTTLEPEINYNKEKKHHKHLEHLDEAGVVAAGGYALHEKHKAKKDPEHAHKHKIEEEIAAAAAVGAGGLAFHEHHEKKETKKEEEEAHGKKNHHLF
ncbi:abscisic stress-ripening protein 3-like [Pyrus x bretschneideri]|uniref:abscisic stress-ripening protein 3-like n=1 Tax=Pyrus x bretschneideri TaxID=225117 RepID=UPI00202FB7F7|nr:abscisic stress-ripening protein 3-like [Pyrus x bretschneideri]